MAVGGGKISSRMLLGFPDEFIDSNTADFQTSKIGGLPDWCSQVTPSSSKLSCQLCSSSLVLVTQIYAPLDNTTYHRTLYLFCCVQPACWNDARSWKCFRSQIKDTSSLETSNNTTTNLFSTTDWCDDADDWGDGGVNDNGNGNGNVSLSTPSPSLSTPSPDSPPPPPIGAVGGITSKVRNLNLEGGNEDANANCAPDDPVLGVGEGVSAEIEKDDELEGFVSVDLPQVDVSHVPGLFQTNNASIPSQGVVVTPMYIWVGEEQDVEKPTQHEINLTKQYQNEEKKNESGGEGTDVYEKTLPRHGDEFTYKFISTLQKNPGQILRYATSTNEAPLVFQQIDKKEISKCSSCGSKLRFEVQLLPTLVNYLNAEGIDGSAAVEFGTVIVYSCTNSCWTDGDSIKQEVVILQQENM